MSDYPMLISNKLHSFRNFVLAKVRKIFGNTKWIATVVCAAPMWPVAKIRSC